MRKLVLTKSGHNKLRSLHKELKSQDIESPLKSVPPGEWCLLVPPAQGDDAWVGHVNSMIGEKYACIQVLISGKAKSFDSFSPEMFLHQKIKDAFEKRNRFKDYADGGRIFYGASDGLAGLIADLFKNACVIQINSAGIDRYREQIRSIMSEVTGTKAYFLDNPRYREKEFLPTYEVEPLPDLRVVENGLEYELSSEIIQKVGFYYDHRENRRQLLYVLGSLKKCPETGVDLFCYAGPWGLNAMRAGVKIMDFVDQGEFGQWILGAIKLNALEGEAHFHRVDVFKFLDTAINEGRRYELILCDPPAFAKSALQKSQALEGYSKLHRKVFKAAAPGAVCVLSSCTHYVGHEEFQRNVLEAAHKEGRSIQLIYCGMQGWDHPVESLVDRSNYIKSYFYILE